MAYYRFRSTMALNWIPQNMSEKCWMVAMIWKAAINIWPSAISHQPSGIGHHNCLAKSEHYLSLYMCVCVCVLWLSVKDFAATWQLELFWKLRNIHRPLNNRCKRTITNHSRHVICMVVTTAMTSKTELKFTFHIPSSKWTEAIFKR